MRSIADPWTEACRELATPSQRSPTAGVPISWQSPAECRAMFGLESELTLR